MICTTKTAAQCQRSQTVAEAALIQANSLHRIFAQSWELCDPREVNVTKRFEVSKDNEKCGPKGDRRVRVKKDDVKPNGKYGGQLRACQLYEFILTISKLSVNLN